MFDDFNVSPDNSGAARGPASDRDMDGAGTFDVGETEGRPGEEGDNFFTRGFNRFPPSRSVAIYLCTRQLQNHIELLLFVKNYFPVLLFYVGVFVNF